MQIKQLKRFSAICEARGIKREASLIIFPENDLAVGDHVMISMGNIISRISAEEAEQAWSLYDEIFDQIDSE